MDDNMTFDELVELADIVAEFDSMTEEEQLKAIGMTKEEVEASKLRMLNMVQGFKFLSEVEKLVKEDLINGQ